MSNVLGVNRLFGDSIRTFGWMEMGYSGSSSGSGPLAVQPRLNQFGNEFLFNELGFVVQKPLKQDQFDWGFNVRYFAGSDAAARTTEGRPRQSAGRSAIQPRLPRPVLVGSPAHPHRRRREREGRAHEHDYRLEWLPGSVASVLLQRLPVLLLAGWSVHRR